MVKDGARATGSSQARPDQRALGRGDLIFRTVGTAEPQARVTRSNLNFRIAGCSELAEEGPGLGVGVEGSWVGCEQ